MPLSGSSRAERGFRKIFILNSVAAVLIACAFGFGAYRALVFLGDGLDRIVLNSSERWAPALAEAPIIDALLAGRPVEREILASLSQSFTRNGITRIDLFTPDGRFVHAIAGAAPAAPFDRTYLEPLSAGEWRLHSHHAADDGGRYLADLFAPVMRGGTLVGALRMELDITAARADFLSTMRTAVALLAFLGIVGLTATGVNAFLITRQRRDSDRIHHLAHNDALTGIANRNRFLAALDRDLAAPQGTSGIALHMIDLDGFKSVNDSLGHDAGDQLLRVIAARIADCAGDDDLVARLGGDEFAVIQRNVETREDAAFLSERMLEAARAVRDLGEVPVSVTLSIGVALAPEHATMPSELQNCADAAVYRAKSAGRNQSVVFEVGMDGELKTRNTLRVMLRRALENEEFELHYQPLHAADSGALLGFEALLRLKDGDSGYISPGKFIPIAEEMGLTPRLGQWVLNEACRTAAAWPQSLSVAVNLSPQQFREDLVTVVESALALSGLAAERLELEITESLFIAEPGPVAEQLHRLKDLGVRIVMDDFGTGYSSLSYLWKFPFDKLKVDRSCFMSLEESEQVGEVLRTISAMSGAMNLRVTAEGIETEMQRTFACQAGYDELQGFLCGRPMPLDNVGSYIQSAPSAEREEHEDVPMMRPALLN